MTRPQDHPTDLLPDHVLGQLDPAQETAVASHLPGCPGCRAEVARLREALFSLADDLPATPVPAGSWERIQSRRGVGEAADQGAALPGPRTTRVPVWPVAAAVAVILAVGGYVRLGSPLDTSAAQVRVQHWLDQGARQITLTSRTGIPYGEMFVRQDGRALLTLKKKLAAGQVYQAWGRQDSGPRAGVPTSLGLTEGTVMEVSWTGYDSLGVSVEPLGGSPAPTHPLGKTGLPES